VLLSATLNTKIVEILTQASSNPTAMLALYAEGHERECSKLDLLGEFAIGPARLSVGHFDEALSIGCL